MLHTIRRIHIFQSDAHAHRTSVIILAIIGFIALVGTGIWIAISSTRFVPPVVNRIGAASVSLGSLLFSTPAPGLSIAPTPVASTTIYFGTATNSTPLTATTSASTQSKAAATTPTPGAKTNTTHQISGATSFYGLSDLAVNITEVGYLTTASSDSFIASSTVSVNNHPAVKFTIRNIGTNKTGAWSFRATVPTRPTYVYQSKPQQSLAPGERIDYTLSFDRANIGADQIISITVNFDRAVTESDLGNDNASATVTILGN
jgi:hypothetical protein